MWALSGARLAGGSVADVVVDGDRIARIGPEASAGVPEVLDCSGRLVLPAFVDGHVHLDKVLIRDELSEHDGTLSGAIEAIHERKRRYSVEDVRDRARAVIEESVRQGTTRLRSHVDVDTIGDTGLADPAACALLPRPLRSRESSDTSGSCETGTSKYAYA